MQKASTRRRKAYWVFFKVSLSYLGLYLMSKLRGKSYWDSRIKEKNRLNAERIRDVMLELQGLFIKFGQLISILSNVLPDEFREPLEALQDNVPPHSFDKMAHVIEKELGQKLDKLYTSFDKEPIAAASIGQVHRATIGTELVVVKIQHPRIDELVHVDLSIIKKIIQLVARFFKVKGIEHLYQQVEQMIEEELNYLQEAQSMQTIKTNLSMDARVYIPKVYEDLSTKKILTMEYCEGTKISNIDVLEKWSIDPQALAESLVEVYCQMILENGFYHADPHPGNILVNEAGQIVFLDFGAVARLSQEMKEGIPKLIECTLKQDTEEMVKVLRKLGFIAHGDDSTKIAEKLIDSIQDFVYNELQLENLNIQNISPDQMRKALGLLNFKEMTQIMQIPKDWVLLNRAVVLVGGVTFVLAPEWNPVETIEPYMRRQILNREGGLAQMFMNTVKTQLNSMIALPQELQKVLRKANKGKLEFEVKSLKKGMERMNFVGQQLVWLILFIASVYFHLSIVKIETNPNLFLFFQGCSVFSFLAFLWSFFRSLRT